MSRTRIQIRQLVAQQFPLPFVSGTSTASDATTVTDLPVLGNYADNKFIGAHLHFPNATVKDRIVTDSVQSSGVLTFIVSDNGGKDGTDAYEVLPYSATAMHQAIDDSLVEAYDHGWLSEQVWLSHWLAGSPIYNSTFDHWTSSTAPAGWALTSVSANRLSYIGTPSQPGQYAVSLASGPGDMSLAAEYRRYLTDFRGYTVTIRMMGLAANASNLRIGLSVDGTITYSGYIPSGGTWEVVSTEVTIANTARAIFPRVDIASAGGSVYIGAVWIEDGPRIREYPWLSDLAPDGPDAIYAVPTNITSDTGGADIAQILQGGRFRALDKWQVYTFDENPAIGTRREGSLIFHGNTPTPEYRLWMPTRIPFQLPTSDTSNVAVSAEDALLIAKMAALKLVEVDNWGVSQATQRRLGDFVSDLQQHIAALSEGRGEHKFVRPLGRGW